MLREIDSVIRRAAEGHLSTERQRGRDSARRAIEHPERETHEQSVLTQGHAEEAKCCAKHQRG